MRKSFFYVLILVTILIGFQTIGNCESASQVTVLELHEEIGPVTVSRVEEAIKEATENKSKFLIIDLDTYGGRIDAAEKVKNLLLSSPVSTIAYVNNKAESAGVLIALACDKIVMNEYATIGSAETIPNTEKIASMWRATLKDTAELKGRNPEFALAMADVDISIEGYTQEGKLLNLTSKDAIESNFADYQSANLSELLQKEGLSNYAIAHVEETLAYRMARILAHPVMATFLLIIAFVAMVVEIFAPGFGVPGVLSLIAFGLFFVGNYLTGNSQWISIGLFVLGLILIGVEIIVPGFGLPGISGIILLVIGLATAMNNFQQGVASISIALIIAFVVGIGIVKKGYKSPILQKVVLNTSFTKEKGYKPSEEKMEYLNQEGIAFTHLRPAGTILIGEEKLDAQSEGGYIEKESKIKVIKVEGSKLIVRRII